ncbi:MAG: hypothetical protein PVG65_03055 [Candidatus Thorarchaeota archaeon]|jgi:hypothetical protein
MSDDEREVVERIIRKMDEQKWEEKCPTCGTQDSENLVFSCESCGKMICSNCSNMTADMEIICIDCVKVRGLTRDELEAASNLLDF